MPALLGEDGLRVHCVPEHDLVVSPDREHKLPVINRDEFYDGFFVVHHLFQVGSWFLKIPDLHYIFVCACQLSGLQLSQTSYWTSSSKRLEDLVACASDAEQLKAEIISSSNDLASVSAVLQLYHRSDFSSLVDLTFEIELEFFHIPNSHLTFCIGDSNHFVVTCSMVLQMDNTSNGAFTELMEH